jgi:2-polyprenyl-3-methyl-5-hydroxy-6-metoxy-1,4-benzoquinol methylase
MDAADALDIHGLVEDPERWEAMIRAEIDRGRTDPAARLVIESIYCEEDRAASFERFARSAELARLLGLLRRLGTPLDARICEIGGGGGWLAWALHRAGYRRLEMLEPNGHFISGTGYLRTRPDAADIRIWNDLDAFYADPGRYDLVLTHNCVHHFRDVSGVAAAIRKKLVPGAPWLMVREYYADTAAELYRLLQDHPYCQRYGVYEMAHPASHYVEAIELAGFTLEWVVPAGYANGVLDGRGFEEGGPRNRLGSWAFDRLLAAAPWTTARLYGAELFANRYLGRRLRRFTRPQAVAFRRREIPENVPVPEWHREVIAERLAAADRGEGSRRPWDQVRKDLLAKLRETRG